MDLVSGGALLLQGLGLAYVAGAVVAAHLATAKAPAPRRAGPQQRRRSGSVAWPQGVPLPGAEDADRQGWRLASALLFMFAGAAMFARDEASAPVLAALVIQQSCYLIRQRRAELSRTRPDDQIRERPSILTVIVFVMTAAVTVLSVLLQQAGALR